MENTKKRTIGTEIFYALVASAYGLLNAISSFFLSFFSVLLVKQYIGKIPNEKLILILIMFGSIGSYVYNFIKAKNEFNKNANRCL